MSSVTDHLDKLAQQRGGGPVARQKNPSGHGHGKWHDKKALAKYRKKRDAKRRAK